VKIFVSPEMFKEKNLSQFEKPMELSGICGIDSSLKLGQVAIETEEGERYLVDLKKLEKDNTTKDKDKDKDIKETIFNMKERNLMINNILTIHKVPPMIKGIIK